LTSLALTPSTKNCDTGIDHAHIDAVDDDNAEETAKRELIKQSLTLSTTIALKKQRI
jgi:hypothetical protein